MTSSVPHLISLSSSTAVSESRDWTQLPPELLEKIAWHLPEIPDLLRFRSVCAPWRSAAKSLSSLLRPQLPWLLLPSDNLYQASNPNASRSRFFSTSENRIYTLPFPEPHLYRICPTPAGWAIAVVPRSKKGFLRHLFLLNPITRSSIPLPPLPLPDRKYGRISNMKLFGPDLVASYNEKETNIFFCRLGDDEWKRIDTTPCLIDGDFAYHNGSFFVFNSIAIAHANAPAVCVFDALTLQKVCDIEESWYVRGSGGLFAESPSGELLRVVCKQGRNQWKRFQVFRLDERRDEPKWVRVRSIGNNVLFVDDEQAMCFPAREGGRGNCIYFVDYVRKARLVNGGPEGDGVRLFDIGTGWVERAPVLSVKSWIHFDLSTWIALSLV